MLSGDESWTGYFSKLTDGGISVKSWLYKQVAFADYTTEILGHWVFFFFFLFCCVFFWAPGVGVETA